MANAGRVAIVPKGDYSSSTAYNRLDLVRYNEKAYVAKKANTGILPTNTEYWMLMTSDGITIDTALSDTSTNPVQNKVVKTALDNIQTTSRATLSTAGWYRVAEYSGKDINALRGARSNSCKIVIKRGYGDNPNEEHRFLLNSVYNSQTFDIVSCFSTSTTYHYIAKIRYTYDVSALKAYIEIYYSGTNSNDVVAIINDGADYAHCWKAITPTLTQETVSGVTVTTTYDIPANASPVTNLDINREMDNHYYSVVSITSEADFVKMDNLHTDANDLDVYVRELYFGVSHPILGGGRKVIEGFKQATNYGYQIAKSWGTDGALLYMRSIVGGVWTEWKMFTTTADLANYLPKTGGTISSVSDTPLSIQNTSSNYSLVAYNGANGKLGYLGFGGDNPVYKKGDNSAMYNILHSGNYTDYALPKSDPSVTGGLTVSRYNNGFSKFHKSHDNGTADYGTIIHDETKDGTKVLLIVQANQNGAFFRDTSGTTHTLFHTGNSAKVAIQSSAPTDTTSLWVDSANKKTKAYIDGAWTALA